jgi:multicomponent Na+:H+ antiporter subunit D
MVLNLPSRSFMKRIIFPFSLILFFAQTMLIALASASFWNKRIYLIDYFFRFNLIVDNLSRVMLLCIGLVLFIALFVGAPMMKDEEKRFNFMNLLIIAQAGMNGVVTVNDIFSLYVFLEITAVVSFVLIAIDMDLDAFEASFKYIIFSVVASVLMLSALAILLLVTGDTNFSFVHRVLQHSEYTSLIMVAIGIFICGGFVKTGAMPFHGWLPDVYTAAPAPISILLAGIVTKTVGIYTLMRIVYSVFGFIAPVKQILLVVGSLSIVVGALAALGQNDFKRMLAYSSISQMGYILIGLGTGTSLGIFGAIFHLFNHSVFKSLLFVNMAAVETQAQTREMDKMSGLASQMPLTAGTSVIGSLSAAGIPPLAGFWSKLIIVLALWNIGYYTYAVIAVLGGVLTLAYFLSLQRNIFFGKLAEGYAYVKEAGWHLRFPALVLATLSVVIGLVFPFIWENIVKLSYIIRG